jgi:hypothetical protein
MYIIIACATIIVFGLMIFGMYYQLNRDFETLEKMI